MNNLKNGASSAYLLVKKKENKMKIWGKFDEN